jgi:CHAD domain-containing protein
MSEPASAHELLSNALRTHMETVRATTARVLATGGSRRAGAGGVAAKVAAAKGAAAEGAAAEGGATKDAGGAAKGGAAKSEHDAEEAVHDFRVGLRRLRTALKPARQIYGKKRLRAISDDLKRYADATSALRDEEVLRKTLADLELPAEARVAVDGWLARRARQERVRRGDVVKMLMSSEKSAGAGLRARAPRSSGAPTIADCLERLEKRLLRPKDAELPASELGQRAVGEAQAAIDALGKVDPEDSTAMHTLRIRYKRLRYTAELFKPALGEGAEHTAKSASKLQSRLGDLHDFDEAMVRIARARGLALDVRLAVLGALRTARDKMAEKCRKELASVKPADV